MGSGVVLISAWVVTCQRAGCVHLSCVAAASASAAAAAAGSLRRMDVGCVL
jgi:hypothetical protein